MHLLYSWSYLHLIEKKNKKERIKRKRNCLCLNKAWGQWTPGGRRWWVWFTKAHKQFNLECTKTWYNISWTPSLANSSGISFRQRGLTLPLSHPGWSGTATLLWEPLASKRAGNHGTERSGPIRKLKALLEVPHKYFLQEITLGCFGTALLSKKNWTLLGFQKGKFKWCHNTS